MFEAPSKLNREQSYAGIQIYRDVSRIGTDRFIDQFIEQTGVRLKERRRAELVDRSLHGSLQGASGQTFECRVERYPRFTRCQIYLKPIRQNIIFDRCADQRAPKRMKPFVEFRD